MITTHKFFKLVILPAVSICMVITGCAEHPGSVSPTPFTMAPSKTPDMTSTRSSFPADPEPAATISIPSVTLLPWFSQEELNANSNPYQSAYYGLGAPPRPGQPPDQIWVDAYECTPNILTIKTGTTVTWIDFDVHDYTIISDDGLFAGEIVPSEFGFGFPGKQTFSYCFESPGAFTWTAPPDYCVSMGVIIVIA